MSADYQWMLENKFSLMTRCFLPGHWELVMSALTHPAMKLVQGNLLRACFMDFVPIVCGVYIESVNCVHS